MFESVLNKLEYFIEKDGWRGWDPYDGLNSTLLRFLTFNNKWLRIAVIQSMKRSPINLRPLLGISKSRNPKAMGLLARTYLMRYKQTGNVEYIRKARNILDWLIANGAGYSGYAWGYNFDWQSLVFYLPQGIPTLVNTSFIANAFLDAYEILKEKSYLDIARSSCDFILKDLNRTYLQSDISNPQSAVCFSYSPLDKTCAHNANLLGAELLARMYIIMKEEELKKCCTKAVEFALMNQCVDGSWQYGLDVSQRFVDSFHTGFILVSLFNIMEYDDYADDSRFKLMLLKGYTYYRKTFFEDNGLPHYFYDKIYPIDLHCTAQGIITFLKFREYDSEAIARAQKLAQWALENMWDNTRGYFYFQKTKHFTNKTPYLRWPNVWMYYALSMLSTEQRAEGSVEVWELRSVGE